MPRRRLKSPYFLSVAQVHFIHSTQIGAFGGCPGVRDYGAIESAVIAPQYLYHYTKAPMHELAAAYAYHISKAQGFIDGNKRTSVVASVVFLKLAGIVVHIPREHLLRLVEQIAQGETSKMAFAAYLAATPV